MLHAALDRDVVGSEVKLPGGQDPALSRNAQGLGLPEQFVGCVELSIAGFSAVLLNFT